MQKSPIFFSSHICYNYPQIIRMEEYIMTVYKTRGVCSRSIEIELDGDTIASCKVHGDATAIQKEFPAL